jgi:HEAT repeat protein
MVRTLRDRDFRLYLIGIGVAAFGYVPVVTFLPLYLKEHVGLTDSTVVLAQMGTIAASLLFSYFWGWASDRYGSKPVMMSALVLMAAASLTWLSLPFGSRAVFLAAGIYFLGGVASTGYGISSARQLFISVPPEKKAHYMPVYYAAFSVYLGLPPLLGGLALDGLKTLSVGVSGPLANPYFLLFAACSGFLMISILAFRRLESRGDMETARFAGMFIRGNPISAIGQLVRYYWAAGEGKRVAVVERLGDVKSPLATDELIGALVDPSFNVRYEAINSIARTPPRPELTEALVQILRDGEPELRAAAAWALARTGTPDAVPALRECLDSEYPLLRSRAARALGTLNDLQSVGRLRGMLRDEPDVELKVAYAVALGSLGDKESAEDILALLREAHGEMVRSELALAASRIVGDGGRFARRWRRLHGDFSGAVSAALLGLRRDLVRCAPGVPEVASLVMGAATALAHEEFEEGKAALTELLRNLPQFQLPYTSRAVLNLCEEELRKPGELRREYVALILHVLHENLRRG